MSSTDDSRSKIVADDLSKDQVTQLVQFMLGQSNGQFSQKGRNIDVSEVPRKKLKFLLHKFLHSNNLEDYGVLDTSGVFEIVHLKPERKPEHGHENLKSTMPFWPPYNVHPVKPSDMIEWQGKRPPTKKNR